MKKYYSLIKIRAIFFCFFIIADILFAQTGLVYIPSKELPKKIAIIGPVICDNETTVNPKTKKLIKEVIKNYMACKGYTVIPLSKRYDASNLKKIYEEYPELNGLLLIKIHALSKLNIAFIQYYKVDGEVCLFKKGKDKALGCWRETVKRRKLSLAADPLGAIFTVFSTVVSSQGNVHIKNAIFEWAFKISNYIPCFTEAEKKPKIIRVLTNIVDKPFKIGDKIVVAFEGSSGCRAFFDINPVAKHIPMTEVKNGIYKGVYVVKQGDSLVNGMVNISIENSQGIKREWIESTNLVNIDGLPPEVPRDLNFSVTKNSIKLKWNTSDTDTVKFKILRSENPLSDYVEIAQLNQFSYEDKDVVQGKKYFYRIIAIDKVGNESKAAQIGPVALPTLTVKNFPETLLSDFGSGKFLVETPVVVPIGANVNLGPNIEIIFKGDGPIKVNGTLKIEDAYIYGDNLTNGFLISPTGRLIIKNSQILKFKNAVSVEGELKAENILIKDSDTGIVFKTIKSSEIRKGEFKKLKTAIEIIDGKINILESNFTSNNLAINLISGDVNIQDNNFLNNGINISSEKLIKLNKNYLGDNVDKFNFKGKVIVESFYNAPFPSGKLIKMSDLIEKAKEEQKKAKQYFAKGNYKKVVEIYRNTIKLASSVDDYILYIYALSLTQDKGIENVINSAIEKYPHEIKLYTLGIKYFLQINEKEKAKDLFEKGISLNPNNPELMNFSHYFEEKDNQTKEGAKDEK